MARGKHRTRADGRRSAQHDAVLRQLEAELATEQQALAEAENALSEVRQLQADVEQERIALAEEVAPIAEELRSERDYLRSVLSDARAHHSWVHEAWDKFSSAAIDASPGTTRIERIETFSMALGVPAWLNDGNSKLSTEQVTRIQRARGERHEASTLSRADAQRSHLKTLLDLGVIAPDLIMPDRRRTLIEQGVIAVDDQGVHEIVKADVATPDQAEFLDEALQLADSVWGSRATSLDPASVHAWWSSPIVSYGDASGPALQSLGLIARPHERTPKSIANELLTIELPVPSTSAATSAHLASYGAERMLTNWRGVIDARQRVAKALGLANHPFAQMKPDPHPGHGITEAPRRRAPRTTPRGAVRVATRASRAPRRTATPRGRCRTRSSGRAPGSRGCSRALRRSPHGRTGTRTCSVRCLLSQFHCYMRGECSCSS